MQENKQHGLYRTPPVFNYNTKISFCDVSNKIQNEKKLKSKH